MVTLSNYESLAETQNVTIDMAQFIRSLCTDDQVGGIITVQFGDCTLISVRNSALYIKGWGVSFEL